jgi:hypothetical protein
MVKIWRLFFRACLTTIPNALDSALAVVPMVTGSFEAGAATAAPGAAVHLSEVNVDEPSVACSVCSLCPDPHGQLHGLRGKLGPVHGPDGASRLCHPQLELLLANKVKVFGVMLVGFT